jgi:hypothetical protein
MLAEQSPPLEAPLQGLAGAPVVLVVCNSVAELLVPLMPVVVLVMLVVVMLAVELAATVVVLGAAVTMGTARAASVMLNVVVLVTVELVPIVETLVERIGASAAMLLEVIALKLVYLYWTRSK